ncbi:unnamed protein product [Brassica rapa subsp. narinosa]
MAYKQGATEIKQHPFFEGVNCRSLWISRVSRVRIRRQ